MLFSYLNVLSSHRKWVMAKKITWKHRYFLPPRWENSSCTYISKSTKKRTRMLCDWLKCSFSLWMLNSDAWCGFTYYSAVKQFLWVLWEHNIFLFFWLSNFKVDQCSVGWWYLSKKILHNYYAISQYIISYLIKFVESERMGKTEGDFENWYFVNTCIVFI